MYLVFASNKRAEGELQAIFNTDQFNQAHFFVSCALALEDQDTTLDEAKVQMEGYNVVNYSGGYYIKYHPVESHKMMDWESQYKDQVQANSESLMSTMKDFDNCVAKLKEAGLSDGEIQSLAASRERNR